MPANVHVAFAAALAVVWAETAEEMRLHGLNTAIPAQLHVSTMRDAEPGADSSSLRLISASGRGLQLTGQGATTEPPSQPPAAPFPPPRSPPPSAPPLSPPRASPAPPPQPSLLPHSPPTSSVPPPSPPTPSVPPPSPPPPAVRPPPPLPCPPRPLPPPPLPLLRNSTSTDHTLTFPENRGHVILVGTLLLALQGVGLGVCYCRYYRNKRHARVLAAAAEAVEQARDKRVRAVNEEVRRIQAGWTGSLASSCRASRDGAMSSVRNTVSNVASNFTTPVSVRAGSTKRPSRFSAPRLSASRLSAYGTLQTADDDGMMFEKIGARKMAAFQATSGGRAVKASDDDDGMSDTSIGDGDGEPAMAAPVLRGRRKAALASADDDSGMIDSTGGGDGELMAAPVLRGRGNAALASAADDGGGMIDSIGGGDGELMAAPVLRGRGNAALAAADDDDNMRYSMGDHTESMEMPCAAVTHRCARLARARAANARAANGTGKTLLPRPGGGITAAVRCAAGGASGGAAGDAAGSSAAGGVVAFGRQEGVRGEAWRLQKSVASTPVGVAPRWLSKRDRDISQLSNQLSRVHRTNPTQAPAVELSRPAAGSSCSPAQRSRAQLWLSDSVTNVYREEAGHDEESSSRLTPPPTATSSQLPPTAIPTPTPQARATRGFWFW